MRCSPGVLLRLAPPSALLPLFPSSSAALGALCPDTDSAPVGLDDELLSSSLVLTFELLTWTRAWTPATCASSPRPSCWSICIKVIRFQMFPSRFKTETLNTNMYLKSTNNKEKKGASLSSANSS